MTNFYIQLILALAFVIGVIYFLGALLRKNQSRDGLMKVLGYQALGPRKGVVAVKIGKDVLILGVTATDLKLFKTITGAEAESLAEKRTEKETTMNSGISDTLKRLKALKDTLR